MFKLSSPSKEGRECYAQYAYNLLSSVSSRYFKFKDLLQTLLQQSGNSY